MPNTAAPQDYGADSASTRDVNSVVGSTNKDPERGLPESYATGTSSSLKSGKEPLGKSEAVQYGETLDEHRSWPQRFVDSFKPAKMPDIDTTGMTEEQVHHIRMASAPMAHSLTNFHIQMIGLGGSIGSGLFVGSGGSLALGGPGGVIVGFSIVGVMLFLMMHSVGEVAVRFPVQGSFAIHTMRLVDDSWGFAMSWNYVLQWIVSFPLELTAAAIILGYWKGDNNGATNVNPAAWVALFYAVLTAIGFTGALAYANAEAFFSIVKVVAIIGFCIFGIVITAGGGPNHHYYGTHYWWDPGSFNHGVKGTVNVFVNSAFAMSGIELSALATSESAKPHIALPRAVKQVFWRVILFYIVSLTICFCLVPYTDSRLGTSSDGKASPFVIAISNAGVKGLPSVFNVVILLAALSVGNAAIFGSSRTIAAIANAGGAPKFLGYIDRKGRPLIAIAITCAVGLIGFIVASPSYEPAFTWMQAISGQSALFTWASISLNCIMLRVAMKKQGRSLSEQYYTSPYGIAGSIIALGITLAILGLQFWTAIFPIGAPPSAVAFFEVWLSLPIVLAFFLAHKIWYRRKPVNPATVDLVSGARIKSPEEVMEVDEDEAKLIAKPKWKRIAIRTYKAWC